MEINLVSPISYLGYGIASYNILKALDNIGHHVSLFPIGKEELTEDVTSKGLIDGCVKRAQLFDSNAPSIRIFHQFSMSLFPGKGPRIGWPIFELDKFNNIELHHLRNLDAIFVCSRWAADVIKNNNIEVPTYVVPLGVDPTIFNVDLEERASRPSWTKDSTVFINIGKWEKRKGHEELLEAFCKAFTDDDDVELWMINDNPFIGRDNLVWRNKYVNSPMGRHVKFFDRLEKHEHLAKIFNHVDAGVFPARGEGWNLEIPELMACGAHIIATNYSGHTEYLTSDNSLIIEPTGMELANDGKWFHGQGSWCTFDINQLVEHLKTIHKKKQNGTLGINTEGVETAKTLSWEIAAKRIINILTKEIGISI